MRQWVLPVPKRLRYFLQRDGAALNIALRILLWVIQHSLCADQWLFEQGAAGFGQLA